MSSFFLLLCSCGRCFAQKKTKEEKINVFEIKSESKESDCKLFPLLWRNGHTPTKDKAWKIKMHTKTRKTQRQQRKTVCTDRSCTKMSAVDCTAFEKEENCRTRCTQNGQWIPMKRKTRILTALQHRKWWW